MDYYLMEIRSGLKGGVSGQGGQIIFRPSLSERERWSIYRAGLAIFGRRAENVHTDI
jgi:hypothetical protein